VVETGLLLLVLLLTVLLKKHEKTCLCVLNKIGVARFSVVRNNRPTDYFYVKLYFQ